MCHFMNHVSTVDDALTVCAFFLIVRDMIKSMCLIEENKKQNNQRTI